MKTNLCNFYVCIAALAFVAAPKLSFAQNNNTPKSVTVLASGKVVTTPIPFKNEQGKTLTQKEAVDLLRTGDYKTVEQQDSNKNPYYLLVKAPGFAPRPESKPYVVKPSSATKPD